MKMKREKLVCVIKYKSFLVASLEGRSIWPLRDLGKVRGRGIRFHKRTDANTAKAEPSIKRIVLKKNRVQYLIYNFFPAILELPSVPSAFR